jgi:hypothetical protein
MPSRAPLVPAGSNSLDPIRGLTKLPFEFLTNLAKTPYNARLIRLAPPSLAARRHVKIAGDHPGSIIPHRALGAWITAMGRKQPCGAVMRKWVGAVGGMMAREKVKAVSHLGLAAGANPIREPVVERRQCDV